MVCRLLFIIPLLAACGSGSSDSSDSGLRGTWATNCQASEVSDSGTIVKMIFAGSDLKTEIHEYSNVNCTGDIQASTFGISTYTLGDQVSELEDTRKLDVTAVSQKQVFFTDELVTEANSAAKWGISDWSKGAEREVTGKKESEDDLLEPTQAGQTGYDIMQQSGNKIRFGNLTESKDGKSAENRPDTLSEIEFISQP